MSTAPRTRYCSRCLNTFTGDPEVCPNLACRARRRREGWGELLAEGDELDRRYRVQSCLAIGGAGITYLAQEEDRAGNPVGPRLAIKVLYAHRDSGHYLRRLATEAQILTELDHPGIVQIRGFVQRAGDSPYLVTRFEEGGSLLDHLSRVGGLELRTAAALGVQLCDALAVAHAKGVIHRDLKPENILLAQETPREEVPRVRLTDWGIAKVQGGVGEGLTRVGTFVGTPQYAAPEQFEGSAPTPSTDLYSLAAVLHFCVTLRPLAAADGPFDPERTLDTLREALPPRLESSAEPPERVGAWNQLLAATMAPEPAERVPLAHARAMLLAIASDQPLPEPPEPAELTFEADPQEILRELAAAEAGPAPLAVPAPPDLTPAAAELPAADPRAVDAPGPPPPRVDAPAVVPPAVAPLEWPADPAPAEGTPASPPPASWPSWDPQPPVPPPSPEPEPPPAPPALDDAEEGLVYAPPPRRGRALLVAALLAGMLGVLGLGGLGAAWWLVPHRVPAVLLPPPQALDPSADAAELAGLQQGLEDLTPELRSFCELGGLGPVELKLVIEPSGRVRALEAVQGEVTSSQARCIRDVLLQTRFPREGLLPVRVRVRVAL